MSRPTRHHRPVSAPRFRGLTLAAACAVLASVGAARAADLGRLEARTLGPGLPAGSAVDIVPGRDDLESFEDPVLEAARAAVARGLARRGLRVSGTAPVKLRIDIHRPVPGEPPSTLDRLEAEPMPPLDVPDVVNQLAIPLQRPSPRLESGMSISMILYDSGGIALWSANASVEGTITRPEQLVQRLSAAAVSQIGANAKRDFLLECEGVDDAERGLCLD